MKNAAAIHDISGFGKCSLTVCLPILSAAGIQTSVVPTAVLSTHTGGIQGYTFRDLTDDLTDFYQHWISLGLKFDALYSGFLGSSGQISIVSDMFDAFRTDDNLIVVDPVMGDCGKLYSTYTPDMVDGIRKLCRKADLIVPNITEACLLTQQPYREAPHSRSWIAQLLDELAALGPSRVVLTGVCFESGLMGAVGFEQGKTCECFSPLIDGQFHGTGDIFSSSLVAALLRGKTLARAIEIAVRLTTSSITRTVQAGSNPRYGVDFENGIAAFIEDLNK